MSTEANKTLLGNAAIAAAIKSGNINIAGAMLVQQMDLSEESKEAQLKHAETLRRFEAQQRARTLVVPTSVDDVKKKLRELGHAVTIFGEGPADRRERLREIIARMELNEEEVSDMQKYLAQGVSSTSAQVALPGGYGETQKAAAQASSASNKEVFYSTATELLIAARKNIADYSFPRAHDRILRTKRVRESDALQVQEDRAAAEIYVHAKLIGLDGSQFVDERPVSCVRYSPNSAVVAAGSWTGAVRLYDGRTLNPTQTLGGHLERVTGLAWQPSSDGDTPPSVGFLASSSADGTCMLWDCRSLDGQTGIEADSHSTSPPTSQIAVTRVSTLKGHVGAVTRCAYHPSGSYVGTAGVDSTWRLWDIETEVELLLQDGHYKECNAIDFHRDGSLVLTGDSGGVALLWDLRSGQCIQLFQGHIRKIVAASFNVNGYMVATGSTDHTAKIWDLRSRKCGYTLPAHSNVLSDVRFSSSGECLVTSSFDGTIKLWNTRNFDMIKGLSGHAGRVMSCDISLDEKHLISAGYDRTIKIWRKLT